MCCPTLAGSGTKTWERTRRVFDFAALIMQNDECRMQNEDGEKASLFVLHSAFCLLTLLLRRAARHLVVDPAVGDLEAVAEPRVRLPAEDLVDQRVVAVAAVDALGGVEVVAAFE